MTLLQLLTGITLALLAQVLVAVAFALRRRRTIADGTPAIAEVRADAGARWRDFRVMRREFEDAAQTQCSFYLQPVDGEPLLPFQPGQYLTFALKLPDGRSGDERTVTRCYSLSDRPDPTCHRITIKRMPAPTGRPDLPPGVSSCFFHDRVQPGDVLKVKAPSGHFFINPDATVPAVLIAGGIGITPMMSMLRWCVAEQPERVVHLYHGVRSSDEQAFKPWLQALAKSHPNFKLHTVVSGPAPEDAPAHEPHHTGHIDLELLRRTLPHGRHQFYVCGPAPMMQSVVPGLRAWGVNEADLHFEAFGPSTLGPAMPTSNAPLTAASSAMEVRFARSGRTLIWSGQDANLLDFAERQGVTVDSGCRSGSCGSCETAVIAGTVDYAEKPDHDIAKGHCLLCVGRPVSALVLEA